MINKDCIVKKLIHWILFIAGIISMVLSATSCDINTTGVAECMADWGGRDGSDFKKHKHECHKHYDDDKGGILKS